jgi:hypothetical protein
LETISDELEKTSVLRSLIKSGRQVVEITLDQVKRFAGNMLFVENTKGEKLLVLSGSAFASLRENQKSILSKQVRMVPVNLPTIEAYGGGSARCMLAEQFLTLKE